MRKKYVVSRDTDGPMIEDIQLASPPSKEEPLPGHALGLPPLLMSKMFREGGRAFHTKKKGNPYSVGTWEHFVWEAGYRYCKANPYIRL